MATGPQAPPSYTQPGSDQTGRNIHLRRFLDQHARRAAQFAVLASLLAGWVFVFAVGPALASVAADLLFVTVPILLAGLFLSPPWTARLAVAQFAAILFLAFLDPVLLPGNRLGGVLIFVGCISILAYVTALIRRRDRAEIERHQLALREADEHFHLVSYATNDVVWEWDLVTGRVWRNEGIQRLFGYPPEEIDPDMAWWQERIHPTDREKVVKGLRAAIDDGEKFWSKEYRFQRVDRSYADVFDRAYIRWNEAGIPFRVQGAVMDITARNHAEEILRQEAVHDPLTGLFNRRYMEEMLEREIRLARINQQPISIIMLDIDSFKQVNDSAGHAAGDAMLHALGNFLLQHVRGTDIACRYGGDEFVLIMPNAAIDVARQRAALLCEGARELKAALYGRPLGSLSLSLGVALFPQHGATREAIMQAADAALYAAKDAGRNQVFVAAL